MYIMAEALTDKVMHIGGFDSYEIVDRHPGAFFEHAGQASVPAQDLSPPLDEYVTMDSGTGCVHTAPGFGADDYQTCLRYGMEMVVPVDDQGRHTAYAGKYAGMKTEESNPVILRGHEGSPARSSLSGHDRPQLSPLLALQGPHHLPRHAAVVLLRRVLQGRGLRRLRERASWNPEWGKDRMISMIRERTDWCISRQRRWGLPIPVFYCKTAASPWCTDETIAPCPSSSARAPTPGLKTGRRHGALPEGFTCPHCGGKNSPRRGHAGRLVRFRLHPLRRHAEGSGLLALHHVYRGSRSVPRLVPVQRF
jgi:isoleucyl-tRNA synthetase